MEKVILGAVYVLLVVTLIIGVILMAFGNTIGYIIIPIEIVYFRASFGSIKEDERGAKFIFGKELVELESGLYFALLGIVKVRRFNCAERQNELPSEPENIYNGDGDAPKGKFKPIRVKFGQPKDNDNDALKNDPYNVAMSTEIVPVVAWKIVKVIDFVKTMKDEDNCLKILTDKTIAIFTDHLSQMTPAKAMLELHSISQTMEQNLRAEIGDTRGIKIIDAYIKPFNFSHGLNSAVVGVSISKQEAIAEANRAEGSRTRKIKEGEGDAIAKKAMLKAEAEMRELMLKIERTNLKKTIDVSKDEKGQFVIWTQTLKAALENSKFSIIPGSELYSAMGGLSEMLQRIKGGAIK